MQNVFEIKIFSFNLRSHSDIDIILSENMAILICFFKEFDDFKQNFFKLSKASLKFQKLHIVFEGPDNIKSLNSFIFCNIINFFLIKDF